MIKRLDDAPSLETPAAPVAERDSAEDRKSQSDFMLIGKPQRKIDGLAKATGRAAYTDDITLPGMLHGKILRSPHPHARILSIETARATALDGVHAVITGKDMPVRYGIIPWTPDEYPLCVDRVRYIGDGVAAVAAVDEDTATEALGLIDVEYEELHAYHRSRRTPSRRPGTRGARSSTMRRRTGATVT